MSKNVLVTGGAGYIGSHTCKALAQAGYLPIAYDNLVTGNRSAVKWGPIEHGDIADQDRLLDVIDRYRPSGAVHFAASAYVGESVTDPAKYYRNNVGGTLVLLECLRLSGINRIVFSSTCATYGIPAILPITEASPQEPINPYGRTKLMVERVLQDYVAAYGFSTVALRFFNAAGADLQNEIGECHEPETHLIPLVLGAALDPGKPIMLFGTDYPTADGTCIRDYIHVNDLAAAHVRALDYTGSAPRFSAFNIGSGNGYSVREVIETAKRLTNLEIATRLGPRREGDPAALVASAERAREALGWQPEYSDIDTIVRTAWSWMRR